MDRLLHRDSELEEQGQCEHGDPNQCTFCQACGNCSESLDDDQFCYDCNAAMVRADVGEAEDCHLPDILDDLSVDS